MFLENLLDERLGGFGSKVPDQQVDTDNGKFFRAAWTVGTVAVLPLGLDVSVDAYGGHDGAREVGESLSAELTILRGF
jgi:hypothetical protein